MSYLQKGLGKIKEAIAADTPDNAEQAISLYMQGLEMLAVARKRASLCLLLLSNSFRAHSCSSPEPPRRRR